MSRKKESDSTLKITSLEIVLSKSVENCDISTKMVCISNTKNFFNNICTTEFKDPNEKVI